MTYYSATPRATQLLHRSLVYYFLEPECLDIFRYPESYQRSLRFPISLATSLLSDLIWVVLRWAQWLGTSRV